MDGRATRDAWGWRAARDMDVVTGRRGRACATRGGRGPSAHSMLIVFLTPIAQFWGEDLFVPIGFVLVLSHSLVFFAMVALKTFLVMIVLKYVNLLFIALETDGV